MDLTPIPDQLFIRDPFVLFSNGNFAKFTVDSSAETGNTLARIAIYGTIIIAAAKNNMSVVLYGTIILALIAFVFSLASDDPPMNTYHGHVRPTSNSLVYDATKGKSRGGLLQEYRTNLLTNVRERNFYLGGVTGTQNPSEYMMGGTRPLAPNRTEQIRNLQFFNNVNNQVWFENQVPTSDWFSSASGQIMAVAS